jgi:hypothetical protein
MVGVQNILPIGQRAASRVAESCVALRLQCVVLGGPAVQLPELAAAPGAQPGNPAVVAKELALLGVLPMALENVNGAIYGVVARDEGILLPE